MRSLLVVDAADRTALDASLDSAADAVVVGVTDAAAGAAVLDWLPAVHRSERRPLVFVRLPSIREADADAIVAALVAGEPDGFVLGQCHGAADVQHLGTKLATGEAIHDGVDGGIGIIAEAGVSARSLFRLDTFDGASERLLGLAWTPGTLADDLGIDRAAAGPSSPLATARSLVLIAARAAGVAAIDGPSPSDDLAAFRQACVEARNDGFNAKLATSAAEVAIINAVFDPDPASAAAALA